MIGRCVSWKIGKGYGFIKGDDMRVYFIHVTDVENQQGSFFSNSLFPNEKYEFDPIKTERGWRAICVRRYEK